MRELHVLQPQTHSDGQVGSFLILACAALGNGNRSVWSGGLGGQTLILPSHWSISDQISVFHQSPGG